MKNDGYPIHGNLNKAISYANIQQIFLSKKAGGKMEQSLDMNNNEIFNVKYTISSDQATNKKYVDDNFLNKLGGVMFGPISMNRNE